MNLDAKLLCDLMKDEKVISDITYMSTTELLTFLFKYKALGVVTYNNNKIRITPQGKVYFLKNRHKILFPKVEKTWNVIPEEMLSERIEINQQIDIKL